MSNIDYMVNPDNLTGWQQKVIAIVDELQELSDLCISELRTDHPEHVLPVVENRQEKIEELQKATLAFGRWAEINLTHEQKVEQNQLLTEKIALLAKVDNQVVDIIKQERERVGESIDLANKGRNFLKSFKKQVKFKERFHRSI
jgi:hypothetical protein